MSQIPALIPTSLLLFALVSLLVGLRSARGAQLLAVAGMLFAFGVSALGLREVAFGGDTLRYAVGNWLPPIGIEFVFDSLAAYMTTLLTFTGAVVTVYAPKALAAETDGRQGMVYPSMLLVLAGLTGMCVTGDIFNLYVFLEVAALAAYALLALGERGAPVATLRYLLFGAVGGGFYLLGVAYLYFAAGTLNMAELATLLPELQESRAVIVAAVLMVLGLAIKMALFPMHFWLPDVYTNTASVPAALIAPIMTKVSAYAIIRLWLDVFPPGFFTEGVPIAAAIGWFSAAGILYGSVLAIAQHDYRRMLAYSSVGQLGYIGLGIGLANPIAMVGALLHIVNHAFMKGLLFMVGGVIKLRTGRTRIPEFVGIGRAMPWTMVAFTIGALAMVGIPPTAGFFSKWYLLLGSAEAGAWVWFAVIVASSLLSAIYFFRVIEMIYRDPERDSAVKDREPVEADGAPVSMAVPIGIMAGGIMVAGIFNVLIVRALLESVVAPLAGGG
ncbi:MAG: NADH/ubiquinone/plastoquinone (complex I) [Gemmatimonadales bacterium]|nr:MAG: NADH/ubiquinone/plastoquinone (complex I) [Gemmatimonadales bacterium]